MLRPKSRVSAVTPKIILLLLSYLFLVSAAIFGLVGSYRVDVLRTELAKANAARDAAEHRETEFKTREAAVAGAEAKIAEAENKATKAQTELLTLQNEKAELESKLDASRNEIAALQKRVGEAGPPASPSQNPSTASKPQQPITSGPSVEIAQGPAEEATPPPPPQPKRRKTAPRKAPEAASTPEITSYSSAKALATFTPLPRYPARERSDSVTGIGVCILSVDPASGRVSAASMEQSTGDSTLDKSAVNAFRKWRFKPGTVSKVRIPIEFSMPGASH
ncbi:MAG: TonB family protein [Candidatus Udaeobacter sp.]